MTKEEFEALVVIFDAINHEHFYTMYDVGAEARIISDFIERTEKNINDRGVLTGLPVGPYID